MVEEEQQPKLGGWQRNGLIFFAALAVRLLYLYQSIDNPTFNTPLIDAMQHHELAMHLLNGGGIDEQFFMRPLLYPLFLAALYSFSEGSFLVTKLIQAGLGALTCLLTFTLARRIFDQRVAWLAAFFVILCGPLLFWEQELVSAGLAALASVVLIHLLLDASNNQTMRCFFIAGVMGGIALAIRPSFLFFVFAAGAWLVLRALRESQGNSKALRLGAAFLLGLIFILGPVGVQSKRALGHFSFLPRTGALNAYIGNNENTCETLTLRPGEKFSDLMLEPYRAGLEAPKEQSHYYREKVFSYALKDPASFLSGLAQKTLQVVGGREVPRNLDIYLFRNGSPALGALLWKWGWFGFPWGFFFPLACVGLALRWRDVPTPLRFLLFLYPLTLVLVFVSGRYRVPLYPVLSILAAAGLFEVVKRVQSRNFHTAGLITGAVVLLALFTNLKPPSCEEKVNYLAEMHVFLGTAAVKQGRVEEARRHYQEALLVEVTHARAHFELGKSFLNAPGDTAAAIEHLNLALNTREDTYARFYLAEAYFKNAELEKALEHFDVMLREVPDYLPAHFDRAAVLYNMGRLQDCIDALEELLRIAYSGWAGEHWKGRVAKAEHRLVQLHVLRRNQAEDSAHE